MNSYFFPNIPLQFFTSVPSAPCLPQDRQFHPGCDQLHSVSLLLRCDAVSLCNLLSFFRSKIAHISLWSKIFLILSKLEYETTRLSKYPVPITKRHGVVKHITEDQKQRIFFVENQALCDAGYHCVL